MTATQLVTVAEITQETYETVESLASSLITEQETSIIADIATWNTNRNDVDMWLESPNGVNLQTRELLNEIRGRVRKHLGLSLYSSETHPVSTSIATSFVF